MLHTRYAMIRRGYLLLWPAARFPFLRDAAMASARSFVASSRPGILFAGEKIKRNKVKIKQILPSVRNKLTNKEGGERTMLNQIKPGQTTPN